MDAGSSQVPPSTGGHEQINTIEDWTVATRPSDSVTS